MTAPLDLATIIEMLAARAPALCNDLLPAGVKEGDEWRVGSVAGEPGKSMAVHLSGGKAGIWCDWSGRPDDRGDALDLIAQVKFGGDKSRAVKYARAWLGLDSIDPNAIASQRRAVEKRKREAVDNDDRRRRLAQAMFLGARATIGATLTERYLLDRGINFRALGRQPGSLRHHDGLVHPETGEIVPAMVAAINGLDGRFLGVHRTFLEMQPNGRVTKLTGVNDAKLSLGGYVGGCIRLWRGQSGKSLRDAPAGDWAAIGEGIEDTASAVMLKPAMRALVAVSLANMGSLELPPALEGVIILAQNDAAGSPAQKALQRAIDNFQRQGKRVKIARPAPGTKDLNDALTSSGGNAA